MSPAVGSGSTRPKPRFKVHKAGLSGQRGEATLLPTNNRFFRAELTSRIYENRACACMHARSTSVRPPLRSFDPRLSLRVAACALYRGQSHGRGGCRHRRGSRHARESDATSCPSSHRRCRQCWRRYHHPGGCSLCFVCCSTDLTQAHVPRQVR